MSFKTVRQLAKEFWIPFCLAAAWTGFRLAGQSKHQFTVADMIATFGAAFFLVSWGTGQIVRVRKQARTEDSLRTVEERLLSVADNLEVTSQNIIGHVTGGESFCYLSFYWDGAPALVAVQQGDHPLYSVIARAVDLDEWGRHPPAVGPVVSAEYLIEIGDLPLNAARPIISEIASKDSGGINIFFAARNGFWTQLVRRASPHAASSPAIRVTRNESDGSSKLLFEQIPPGMSADKIEW